MPQSGYEANSLLSFLYFFISLFFSRFASFPQSTNPKSSLLGGSKVGLDPEAYTRLAALKNQELTPLSYLMSLYRRVAKTMQVPATTPWGLSIGDAKVELESRDQIDK